MNGGTTTRTILSETFDRFPRLFPWAGIGAVAIIVLATATATAMSFGSAGHETSTLQKGDGTSFTTNPAGDVLSDSEGNSGPEPGEDGGGSDGDSSAQGDDDFDSDSQLPDGSFPGGVPSPTGSDAALLDQLTNDAKPDPIPEPPTKPVVVNLDLLPPNNPAPEPEPDPEPDPSANLSPVSSGTVGGLTSNAFGCSSRCITKATLHKNIHNANLRLEMTTNVTTTKSVWLLSNGPMIINGVPANQGVTPIAVDNTLAHDWSVEIAPLKHNTTYRIVVAARDSQGNIEQATTQVTTTAKPTDDFVAPGSPCVFDCLTSALVTVETYHSASIAIKADGPVTFDVAVSASKATTMNGTHYLPSDLPVTNVQSDGTTYSGNIGGLNPGTKYYVLVTVTDDAGMENQALGSFETPTPPPVAEPEKKSVVVWVDRAHIHQDGDAVGKGEISMRHGIREMGEFETEETWFTPYDKVGEGESVYLGGLRLVKVSEGQTLPPVIVNAIETDSPSDCPFQIGTDPLVPTSGYAPSVVCGAVTAAVLDNVTLETIADLPTCEAWDVPELRETDRCMVLQSSNPGSDFVVFDVLIGFHVT